MVALKKYSWPGNIRELENVIEHAFVLENENQISLISYLNISCRGWINLPEYDQMFSHNPTKPSSAGIFLPSPNSNPEDDAPTDEEDVAPLASSNSQVQAKSMNILILICKKCLKKNYHRKALKMFKGRINQTSPCIRIFPKKTLLRKLKI